MEKIYALFRMNILIFVLLAATVIALTAYHKGLNDIVFLNLSDYPYIIAQTDSADGGNSAVKLIRTDSSVVVDYELREGYAYPFAGIKILLGDGQTKGLDLSHYDSIFVWIKPRGEGTVRLYMRSYDPSIYREGDESSLKFNELEFFPLEETYPAVFVPQEFRVAGWWVAQNEINVHKARVDLSNVPLIEIQTGTNAPLGYGTMEIRGLCFKGKKIAWADLVTIIVAIWFVTFLIILIIRFFDYSRERAANKKKREELEKRLDSIGAFVPIGAQRTRTLPGNPVMTHYDCTIDSNGNMTVISGCTNDPKVTDEWEKAGKSGKKEKSGEAKLAERRAKKRAEERRREEAKAKEEMLYRASGRDVGTITESLLRQMANRGEGKNLVSRFDAIA